MGWLRALGGIVSGQPKAATQSDSGGRQYSANDPRLLEAIRSAVNGAPSADLMRNGAINRAVRLHCESIGMLPLHLMYQDKGKGKAKEHPLFSILHRKPNNWQTAYEFKRLMQAQILRRGVAYAQIVRSRERIIQLQPLAKFQVVPKQNADWSITYEMTNRNGVKVTLAQNEVLAIRDLDLEDGVSGGSRVDQARDSALMTATIKQAVKKLFDNNMQLGGALSTPNKLSPEARNFLKASMAERTGAENAGKWILLEEDLKANPFENSLGDNQQVENLHFQIEEIARIMGTPRPLLMMDETAWGSGIEALGLFFIQYCLSAQFTNWEQAISRDCLTEKEQEEYVPKFNEGALLRGSMKDQAEFFTKALGSGGGRAWMTQDEIRGLQDLPAHGGEADVLPQPTTSNTGAANVPANPA
ncbi:phage portal protein [Agrobacterium vitis]|uniref:phage portal protein n=1 Tax=Agrobacterium vitis TaxID=373 RepID=UPI001F30E0AE|nr:phage portal protein [Agrobacterium vitis]MCF1452287.1 phage portal protein [Agrobacterium vitis]